MHDSCGVPTFIVVCCADRGPAKKENTRISVSLLLVDLKRLELSTSRMRTERSPKRAGFSSLQTDKMFERC